MISDHVIWDIVRLPFPYTNRPIEQYRPGLVVGRYQQDTAPSLLWVLMITSAVHRRWPGDVEISDLASGGLPIASVIRCAKIATVEARDAERVGALIPADRPAVQAHIMHMLGAVAAAPSARVLGAQIPP